MTILFVQMIDACLRYHRYAMAFAFDKIFYYYTTFHPLELSTVDKSSGYSHIMVLLLVLQCFPRWHCWPCHPSYRATLSLWLRHTYACLPPWHISTLLLSWSYPYIISYPNPSLTKGGEEKSSHLAPGTYQQKIEY